MKLLQLHLRAFGPFSDRVLDFGTAGPTLFLIYGPNEAGKSATLRAMSDLRFGIPDRSPDNFVHAHPDMRVGGVFLDAQGRQHSLMRRKGRGATLSYCQFGDALAQESQSVPADIEALLTAGLSRKDHDTLFALDHQRLREGGESLVNGEGEVGAALFEASAGVQSISGILKRLDDSARTFFMPGARGKNARINEALRVFDEQHGVLRKAIVRPSEWLDLHKRHETAASELANLEADRTTKQRQLLMVKELRAVAPLLSSFDQATERLAQLSEVVLLSPNCSTERAAAEASLVTARSGELNAAANVARQQALLGSIQPDAGMLASASAIGRLITAAETLEPLRKEATGASADAQALSAELALLASRMAPDDTLETLLARAPATAVKVGIEEKLRHVERAEQALEQHRVALASLKEDASETVVAPMPPSEAKLALGSAQDEVKRIDATLRRLAALPVEIAAAQRAVTAGIASLGLLSEESLGPIRPLLDAEIDSAVRLADEAKTRGDELNSGIAKVDAALAAQIARRESFLAAGAVPTADDVSAARADRQKAWLKVRAASIDRKTRQAPSFRAGGDSVDTEGVLPLYTGRVARPTAGLAGSNACGDTSSAVRRSAQEPTEATMREVTHAGAVGIPLLPAQAVAEGQGGGGCQVDTSELARAYEEAVQKADTLVDELARDTKRATELQACLRQIDQLERDSVLLSEQRQQLSAHEHERRAAWLRRLSESRLPGIAPSELREWQAMLGKTREAFEMLILKLDEKRHAQCLADEVAASLRAAIVATGMVTPSFDATLRTLLAMAAEIDEQIRRREQDMATAAGKRTEREASRKQLEAHEQALSHHLLVSQQALQPCLMQLLLAQTASLAVGRTRLEEFDALLALHGACNAARLKEIKCRDSLAAIERQTAALAQALGDPDPKDMRLYIDELSARLVTARKVQAARALAEQALQTAIDSQRDYEESAAKHARTLNALCTAAGVSSPTLLPEVEDRSQRKREAQAEWDRARNQLALASRRPLEELRALLSEQDLAQLEANEARWHQDITALDGRLPAARASEEAARRALEAIDSADVAASAREGMEHAAAGVRRSMGPWVRSKLAHALLAEALKRFRERAQGPMLKSASTLFQRMTDNEFVKLVSDGADIRPILLAQRKDGSHIQVEGMSEGTRDQLYLALRLAALELRRSTSIDLPVILDDVLMTSDDQRAGLMLQALAEFSKGTQVMVFTHHRHLLDVAQQAVPAPVLATATL